MFSRAVVQPVLDRFRVRGIPHVDVKGFVIIFILDDLRFFQLELARRTLEQRSNYFGIGSRAALVDRLPKRGVSSFPLFEELWIDAKDLADLLI